MNNQEIFINIIKNNLDEANATIDELYTTSKNCRKSKLLNRLRKNISNVSMVVQGLHSDESVKSTQLNEMRLFTQAELSKYNGKGGNPAYVAVNGIVYDVTNNAAWGGATHFGLAAGNDVTGQFASCHAGQPTLGKLKIVGKMA